MTVKKSDPDAFHTIIDILIHGGVVIIPCDTIYGVVGTVPETESRIRKIKRRETKPFIQLFPDTDHIENTYDIVIDQKIVALWPGPLTVILKTEREKTTSFRVPDDPWLVSIIKTVEKPLFSTSVNFSGMQSLWKIAEIQENFDERVDCIIDAGELPGGQPSTILDAARSPYRILRQGACHIPPYLLD